MMFPKKKWGWSRKPTKVSLLSKLDKVFSEFIRLRDVKLSGHTSYLRCVTCKATVHWKESDAGHFVSRNHKATRFNEKNVHGQCRSCNRFHAGEQFVHGREIDKKYGPGTSDNLVLLSKMKFKINDMWLAEKLKHYRAEVKRLKGELGL